MQAHQTLTLNPRLAARHARLSLAHLQAEVDVSVELLRRVIDHFKAQHKRVVVVGYPYGSFLVARYLALHGPDGADRYLLMAGRLDMPTEFVDGALAGMLYHFPNTVAAELSDRRPTTDQESIELRHRRRHRPKPRASVVAEPARRVAVKRGFLPERIAITPRSRGWPQLPGMAPAG